MSASPHQTALVNGRLVARAEARISIFDRGFTFGDGVYEVIPVYGGTPFRFAEHLRRLQASLQAVRITDPYPPRQWRHHVQQLIEANGGGSMSLYLQVTRGVAERDHRFPQDIPPTVVGFTTPLQPVPETVLRHGARIVLLEDFRWDYCHIKTISLLANVLARQQALDEEAAEAVFVRDGHVVEGAASNVFVVRAGTLLTPPKNHFLLPGITRDLILELARHHTIPTEESPISKKQFLSGDEIWLSSSTREIIPVTRVGDQMVGTGRPGPLWNRMYAFYQQFKQELTTGH